MNTIEWTPPTPPPPPPPDVSFNQVAVFIRCLVKCESFFLFSLKLTITRQHVKMAFCVLQETQLTHPIEGMPPR